MQREGKVIGFETWLSTKEVAWIVDRTERCVRYWVKYKTIPCARGAGEVTRHKFRAIELLEWLKTTPAVKDPNATRRLISLMSVSEVPSQMLVDFLVHAKKEES